MANPKFWYYPDSETEAATLESLDLGQELSDLQFEPSLPVEQAIGIDGRLWSVLTGASRLGVRIVLERFTDEAVAWALQTMESHLMQGYHVAFARDPDNSWAGYLTDDIARGNVGVQTTGPVWNLDSSPSLAIGDWICIEELGGSGKREYAKLAAIATTATTLLTLSSGLKNSFSADSIVLVRHIDFFPSLVWPAENRTSPIVTHDRRLSWTLDVGLISDPVGLQALYDTAIEGGNTPLIGSSGSYAGITLETVSTFGTDQPMWGK